MIMTNKTRLLLLNKREKTHHILYFLLSIIIKTLDITKKYKKTLKREIKRVGILTRDELPMILYCFFHTPGLARKILTLEMPKDSQCQKVL